MVDKTEWMDLIHSILKKKKKYLECISKILTVRFKKKIISPSTSMQEDEFATGYRKDQKLTKSESVKT